MNPRAPGWVGLTGEAEPEFLQTVTGRNLDYLEGIELGRKIWNLDNAIWSLQGRHRDMVHFSSVHYQAPGYGYDGGGGSPPQPDGIHGAAGSAGSQTSHKPSGYGQIGCVSRGADALACMAMI